MSMTRKPINSRIEELRKSIGLTQQQFGVELGIDEKKARSMVQNWEQADIQVKSDVIIEIARRFNVSADWLLGISDNMTNDRDLDYVCSYTGLSIEAINTIRESFQTSQINPEQQKQKKAIANEFVVAAWKLMISHLWDIHSTIEAVKDVEANPDQEVHPAYKLLPLYDFERFCRMIPEILFDITVLED